MGPDFETEEGVNDKGGKFGSADEGTRDEATDDDGKDDGDDIIDVDPDSVEDETLTFVDDCVVSISLIHYNTYHKNNRIKIDTFTIV